LSPSCPVFRLLAGTRRNSHDWKYLSNIKTPLRISA
jgi:hypothetical protein